MCIYESLLFHPKIFSMSTHSKHGDMNTGFSNEGGRGRGEGVKGGGGVSCPTLTGLFQGQGVR